MKKWTSLMLALLMMSVAVGAFAESQDILMLHRSAFAGFNREDQVVMLDASGQFTSVSLRDVSWKEKDSLERFLDLLTKLNQNSLPEQAEALELEVLGKLDIEVMEAFREQLEKFQDLPFEPSPHSMDAGLNQLYVVHEGKLILIAVSGDNVGESQDPAAQALIQLWQKAIQAFEDLQ